METDKQDDQGAGPDLSEVAKKHLEKTALRQKQFAEIGRVSASGTVEYFTGYDAVTCFHAGALSKGISYIGRVSDNPPADVLVGRRNVIDEEVNKELFLLLDKVIANGGAISLEQRAEMLDHIVDSVYVLMGLAVNFGLPFDLGFQIVQQANMKKLFMEGAPIFREDGKLMKPEGWEEQYNPEKLLWEAVFACFKLEQSQKPQVQNNLPDPKGTEGNDNAIAASETPQSFLVPSEQKK